MNYFYYTVVVILLIVLPSGLYPLTVDLSDWAKYLIKRKKFWIMTEGGRIPDTCQKLRKPLDSMRGTVRVSKPSSKMPPSLALPILLLFSNGLAIVSSSCSTSAPPWITGCAAVGAANLKRYDHPTLEHVRHEGGVRRKSFALDWVTRARGGGGGKVT